MNTLPNYTSFQGVLDSIIRSYLLNELPPEVGDSSNANIRHTSAERDLGIGVTQAGIPPEILQNLRRTLREQGLLPSTNNNAEVNNNQSDGQVPGTSQRPSAAEGAVNIDQEYIKALYRCFEKRGVFKELQTFLRHKLVSILQDEFPSLQQQSSQQQQNEQNVVVCRLIEDFLRCHKLLYTLSVMASESDVKQTYSSRALHGKLSSNEAEDLLDELGIKKRSRLSGQVLKCYFDNASFSLLETMHYLGIWLDGQLTSANHNDCGNEQINSRIRRESGRRPDKRKSTKRGDEDQEDSEKERFGGVERRLYELERRMQKEKDSKIAEAIDKFKEEELQRFRKELETKMNLKIIEKEKEYLLDMQGKLEEINKDVHQEKQGWLEVKLRQEKELCELRKQLSEKILLSTKKGILSSEQTTSIPNQSTKSKNNNSHKEDRENDVGRFPSVKRASCIEAIQQDKLVFLQYQLEKQEEEIKSLKRQLILNSHLASPSSSKGTPVSVKEVTERGGGDADDDRQPKNEVKNYLNESHRQDARSSNERLDDLDKFLKDTRARLEKLDTAAAKIDEIVQEVTEKKRKGLGSSSELSARLLSVYEKRAAIESQYPPGVYNVEQLSPIPTSSMATMASSLAPLSRQQLPEKQVTFLSTELSNLQSYNNFDIFRCKRPATGPSRLSLLEPVSKINKQNIIENVINEQRPETPVNRQFQVSYENQNSSNALKKLRRQDEDVDDDKPSAGRKRSESLIVVRDRQNGQRQDRLTHESSLIVEEEEKPEVVESLFHMSAKQSTSPSSGTRSNSSTPRKENACSDLNLKEKALRNGALSKQKVVTSDDEDEETSKSVSISESIRIKLARSSKESSPRIGNKNGALSKSVTRKINENWKELPVKAQTRDEGSPPLETHFPRAILQEFHARKLRSSSSSSSSSKGKGKTVSFEKKGSQNSPPQEEQNDLSSISISVPKSDDDNDDENNDFWQL